MNSPPARILRQSDASLNLSHKPAFEKTLGQRALSWHADTVHAAAESHAKHALASAGASFGKNLISFCGKLGAHVTTTNLLIDPFKQRIFNIQYITYLIHTN
jgi:hypothetical protein